MNVGLLHITQSLEIESLVIEDEKIYRHSIMPLIDQKIRDLNSGTGSIAVLSKLHDSLGIDGRSVLLGPMKFQRQFAIDEFIPSTMLRAKTRVKEVVKHETTNNECQHTLLLVG